MATESDSISSQATCYPKAVVTFAGARDRYQLPLALFEAEMLEAFVTDFYWPVDTNWFAPINYVLPQKTISARFCADMGSTRTRISSKALAFSMLARIWPKPKLVRCKDNALGQKARSVALKTGSAIFSTNYYATEAFKPRNGILPKYRFLFQMQADVQTLRQILLEEIDLTPYAKDSLMAEYELSLSQNDLQTLSCEPELANGWVTSCSFAASTLADRGISREKINVVPLGVASNVFSAKEEKTSLDKPFRIVYVGSIIQRKGLSYLIEAVRRLESRTVQLILFTRGPVDQGIIKNLKGINYEIRFGLSGRRLAHELQQGDVFVFPSLAEGFGLVILEAMACGLPVIATSHTCAPDVLTDGIHGFTVPIRDPMAIVEKLEWGITHRSELATMGMAAAEQAQTFTWERFRAGIRTAYQSLVEAVG